ncbi:hypothetical protein GO986_03280 [Deinococcus sp. HMF7620]|uniref:Lipoprotein n=1 Tax=Deinococcus arboris TaxID=2682977 RepID=A0A7C9M038_9DEIO|nr:hypothetical protein [Deinococcus arboris]MVN85782.1 hypothetical protein [Deinococcus arboris]
MKRFLLAVPLLLAACAPAYTGPAPAANEVIVEAVSPVNLGSQLSPEREAGVSSFAQISAMLIVQSQYNTGLPGGYDGFTFPEGSDSMKILSAKEAPIHVQVQWRATNPTSNNTVDVLWESRPLGGKLVSVKVKATASDASVNTQQIETRLLDRFLSATGIRLVARGK